MESKRHLPQNGKQIKLTLRTEVISWNKSTGKIKL